ncbi:MAG: hypothetical protein ACYC6M_13110, partial [Terriglobales bacterium]
AWGGALLLALVAWTAAAQPQAGVGPSRAAILAGVNRDLAAHRPAAAIRRLQTALAGSDDWVEGWTRLGSLLYEQDDYRDARLAYARLTQMEPRAGAAWV